MAGFLVKTPYVLLLTVSGINVVSAARRLAGEGRTDRALPPPPAPHQRAKPSPLPVAISEVTRSTRTGGALVRQCNRRLRGAAMLIAENLIKCATRTTGERRLYGPSTRWIRRVRRCRIANARCGWFINSVGGRQVKRGRGVEREYLLAVAAGISSYSPYPDRPNRSTT